MRQTTIVALAWLLGATAGYSQGIDPERLRVNINAEFVNDYGDAVEGVKVTLITEDLSRQYEATVKADGTLRFESVRPGTYLVQMQLSDYVFLRADEKGTPFVVTVNNDGTLTPSNFRANRKAAKTGGMWREILIFFGIAGAGGAAAI